MPTVLRQAAERARRGGRVRLPGLHAVGLGRGLAVPGSALGSVADRVGEVGVVEQVEDLDAELDVRPAAERRTASRPPRRSAGSSARGSSCARGCRTCPGCGVANAAGFRNSSPPSLMNGSTPGTRSGRRMLRDAPPPGVLMTAVRSAAGLFEHVPGAVDVDDVVAGDRARRSAGRCAR